MSNTDRPNGFRPVEGHWNGAISVPHVWPASSGATIARGDMVYLDSAGRIAIATSSTAAVIGVAATPVSAAAAGDSIWVFDDPNQVFEGQCSGSGALADPYTCATSTSCFDLEGTTGIMEINEDSSSYDIIQVIGVGYDPLTGEPSAVGTNQRKYFKINRAKHQLNTN